MRRRRLALHAVALALRVGAAGIASVALGQLVGCEKPSEPTHAPTPRGLPPINPDELQPSTDRSHAEHAPTDPHMRGLPAGHPAMGDDPHGGNPHGGDPQGSMEALSPGDIEFDKKTVIAGTLQLDGKLKDKVKPGDTIYLVVRGSSAAADSTPGPVLAVKRLEAASFPMPFQLDSRDAMVVGTQLKPPVVVSVRVDKDGDAMTKNPGDVTGSATIKSLPVDKLKLSLDTVL